MNWDEIAGKWKQFKGNVQQQWGKLTNDDLDEIAGQREKLIGRVQERYGSTRAQVEKELESLCESCCDSTATQRTVAGKR